MPQKKTTSRKTNSPPNFRNRTGREEAFPFHVNPTEYWWKENESTDSMLVDRKDEKGNSKINLKQSRSLISFPKKNDRKVT